MKLTLAYKQYKTAQRKYVALRKQILKEPEEELAQASEDLNLSKFKEAAEKELKKQMKKAWKIYQKVYGGEPTREDIDEFLGLSDEISACSDIVPDNTKKVLKVSRDLVWAFGEAFNADEESD